MKNKTFLYGFGGLLIGTLVATIFYSSSGQKLDTQLDVHAHDGQNHSMTGTMDAMTSQLSGKTGDAFDKAFLREMIVHHEGAIEMAELVLKNSKRPELTKLANDIISAQTKEIEMMKIWEKEWFTR